MKKISFSIVVILLFLNLPLKSENVDLNKAEKVAKNFYYEKVLQKTDIKYQDIALTLVNPENSESFYIFNINEKNGFVIIASDDRIDPIIGYSLNGHYSTRDQSPAFTVFMNGISEKIGFAKLEQTVSNVSVAETWNRLNAAKFEPIMNRSLNSVDPLINTSWSQGEFYNAACPEDTEGEAGHTATGCASIAMAQIMKFYQYPESGNGSHSYETEYGTQTVNFSEHSYNWNQMPSILNDHNEEVANLIYHCGVSIEMNYDPEESGYSPYKIPNALINNFEYNTGIEYVSNISFTEETWRTMLTSQLNSGMPVFYVAYDSLTQTGHTWLCDGYSADNLFHMNWGLGSNDGYFSLSNLAVETTNLSQSHQAITNICPPNFTGTLNQAVMNWDWAVQQGGMDYDTAGDLIVDNNDDIIVTGVFSSSTPIGDETYTNLNHRDLFLAKYNSESEVIWSRHIKSNNTIGTSQMTYDNDNNIYFSIAFKDTAIIGSDTIFSPSDAEMDNWDNYFSLIKLDATGNMLWYKTGGGSGVNGIRSIACDQENNVYFTARMSSNQEFDEIITGSGSLNCVNVKLNETGELLWHNIYSGGNVYGKSIAVNGNGDIIIFGSFHGTATFDGTQVNSGIGSALYVASYSTNQELNWFINEAFTVDQGIPFGMEIDKLGNIYVTGVYKDSVILNNETILSYDGHDSYFIKYNSSGELQWYETLSGNGNIYVDDIDFNSDNTPFIVGTFGGSCTLGDTTIYDGCTGSFIFSMDAETGERGFVSNKHVMHYNLGFDSVDNLYINGAFNSTTIFGSEVINPIDYFDIYLVKLLGSLKAKAGFDISICRGENTVIGGTPTILGGSAPYTYAWEPSELLNDVSVANPIATPIETTEFFLTVTDNQGNIATDEVIVVVDLTTPVFELGPDTTIAMGGSIVLTNSTDYPGIWSTNDFTNNLEVFETGVYTLEVINACGSTMDSIEVSILDNTLINKYSKLNDLKIYPNPSNGQFTIQIHDDNINDLSIEVFDYTGKLLQSKEVNKPNSNEVISFDIRSLDNGLYILKLSSEGDEVDYKISILK